MMELIKHAMAITVLLSIFLLGISSAYFPANIVAGSYYANVITNFSGYGLTTANITVISKINTTNYYLFSFNDSADGLQLNCTTPYPKDSDSYYVCYGYNRSIRHNTILNLYGLLGNATNYISQNLSILAVTPSHPYNISTEILLNGNVVVNESVQTKIINITDINSSQESFTSGISLNCRSIGPSYITGNLTLTFYPAKCYYNGQLNLSALDTNSIIQNAVLANVISNNTYQELQFQNLSIEVYRPLNLSGTVPNGYSSFYSLGALTRYSNGSYLPSIAEVQSVYACSLPRGPLLGVEYDENFSSQISLYEYYKGNSDCYLDFYFPSGMNISVIQKLPSGGKALTTITINTTTTTTIPQHHNRPTPKPTKATTTSVSTTTTTVSTTVTTTIAPTPQTKNNKKQQEENNTRNTAAVAVVVTSASTTAFGTMRRFGRK